MCDINWERFDAHKSIIHFRGNGAYEAEKNEELNQTHFYMVGDMSHPISVHAPSSDSNIWQVFMVGHDFPESFTYQPPCLKDRAQEFVDDLSHIGGLLGRSWFNSYECFIDFSGNGWYVSNKRHGEKEVVFQKKLPMSSKFDELGNLKRGIGWAKVVLTNQAFSENWLRIPLQGTEQLDEYLSQLNP